PRVGGARDRAPRRVRGQAARRARGGRVARRLAHRPGRVDGLRGVVDDRRRLERAVSAGTTATARDVTAATHTYATLDVPVAGGRLRVGVWDPVGPHAPEPAARPGGARP